MSPVSPVFHTEVTVKLYAVSVFLFGNKSGCGKISRPSTNPYPNNLVNRLRRASGPVHPPFPLH